MPGAYPHTSTYALTNATLPYVKALARYGAAEVCSKLPAMATALNTYDGKLYNAAVAEALGMKSSDISLCF
jgi:alanine dehydrogenase